MIDRYFDYAATTPLDPRVRATMERAMELDFGNPHSIHSAGRQARRVVDWAREQVAALIEAEDPSQIVFTSGATESNNWIAAQFAGVGALSPFEHSSMREAALRANWTVLEHNGLEVRGSESSKIVSIMSVNNEIGARWDAGSLLGHVRHSDLTQQVGKLPTSVAGLDFASFSAHKFYGPKGVGVLYLAEPPLAPLMVGGGQEQGQRGGTLNVPGIVGMGAAAEIARDEIDSDELHASEIRNVLVEHLMDVPGMMIFGAQLSDRWSPYILTACFADVEGESVVIELDNAGFMVSSGAACSSQSTEPSHVLTALDVDPQFGRGAVRISLGRFSTIEKADELGKIVARIVEKLRRMKQ